MKARLKQEKSTQSDHPIRRIFEYDKNLLPNKYIASLESESHDLETALQKTGLTVGYPAWNLLYYSLLSHLNVCNRRTLIVETGTNWGFSTIILAQALKDSGLEGLVWTVDIDQRVIETAKDNLKKAGLLEKVVFNCGDSLTELKKLVKKEKFIDFAFLDGNHDTPYVVEDFSIVYSRVVAAQGKIYLDNTQTPSVSKGIKSLKKSYGGNWIEFKNCSWKTNGQIIWQA